MPRAGAAPRVRCDCKREWDRVCEVISGASSGTLWIQVFDSSGSSGGPVPVVTLPSSGGPIPTNPFSRLWLASTKTDRSIFSGRDQNRTTGLAFGPSGESFLYRQTYAPNGQAEGSKRLIGTNVEEFSM